MFTVGEIIFTVGENDSPGLPTVGAEPISVEESFIIA